MAPTSHTRQVSGKAQVSSTMPMRDLMASSAALPQVTGCPNRRTVPASAAMMPRIALMVVVLPAPFDPMKPTTQPGSTARLTPESSKSS